ncbi:MAG: glutathione S-transferase family protein [Leptospiraceae bacterium]|nr:glutathione S-transferase family protein [Leptospiraceae bacterium]
MHLTFQKPGLAICVQSRPAESSLPRVYLMDISYFSGKFESYLRYKEIPFERITVTHAQLLNTVYAKTGLMKVPVMQTADGHWLSDTSPMIAFLEQAHPSAPVLPADPARRFLALLIEDYCDEWLWRPAMYYRWAFAPDRALNRLRAGREILSGGPLPGRWLAYYFAARQYLVFVRGDGVRRETRPTIEELYLESLSSLSNILREQPFLSGSAPGLVDFAFMGPMFRHFSIDPTPASIMRQRAPEVYEWVARLWNARASSFRARWTSAPRFDSKNWDAIFLRICRDYLPYLLQNARAFRLGRRRFDHASGGVLFRRLRTNAYRVLCRERLRESYLALASASKRQVDRRLNAIDPHWAETLEEDIASGQQDAYELPHRPLPPVGYLEKAWRFLGGTPRDRPASRLKQNNILH